MLEQRPRTAGGSWRHQHAEVLTLLPLYLYSLGVPAVADAVRGYFADILDSADGRLAQLYIAARLPEQRGPPLG